MNEKVITCRIAFKSCLVDYMSMLKALNRKKLQKRYKNYNRPIIIRERLRLIDYKRIDSFIISQNIKNYSLEL